MRNGFSANKIHNLNKRKHMEVLSPSEVEQVSGAMSDFTTGGIAVISIGFAGGPATAAFGLLVGGAMLVVGYYQ
ncbi:hypothetical protein GJ700_21840 [Duganella sp. FT92W]|uniref:Bacteriocin n=1 Tax=Pseudoduganella rivuli TaxID=2666085 RepID=A0A7X2IQY9_9BURK|nr:hypothetical protein [Pseudoduganella rivuli]MRV74353.1 hypothetical protein [Pseudoduganella rivuli]